MLTDNRADERTQDWFLIACEGDLVLKLAQDLMIGEDERGQTVLSPAREDALLRITSENGCLTLQALAMDWTFSEEGGLSVQHLTFVEGLTLKLSFPNSSLILTPDFRAGPRAKVDREIKLTPTETPTLTLTRVDEPVTLVEPVTEVPADPAPVFRSDLEAELLDLHELEEAAAQALAADALTRFDHQIPDEQVESDPAKPEREVPEASTIQSVAAEPETEIASVATAEPDASTTAELVSISTPTSRRRHRPLSGLIAAAALLTPMALYLVDASKLGVDFPLTNYLPLTEQAASEPAAATPEPAVTVPVSMERVTSPSITTASPAYTSAPAEPERRAPSTVDSQQLLIASLLAEAKAFYAAGLIVTPIEANTVSHLTQVLSMDPNNEEGLRLMYMSAVTLIEEAEAAHAAGDNYLARNLVEDVLGFHPEFNDARVLLDSWTRVPEG